MGGDVRRAAAVAVGSLGSLDVEVQQFHLSEDEMKTVLKICHDNKNNAYIYIKGSACIQRKVMHVLKAFPFR